MHSDARSYLDVAQIKQKQRQKRIPKAWLLSQDQLQTHDILSLPEHCGILTTHEFQITQHFDAVDIVNRIASGELSAREVAVAFCKRAAIAQQVVRFKSFTNLTYSFLTRPDQLSDGDFF
jgi:amidase